MVSDLQQYIITNKDDIIIEPRKQQKLTKYEKLLLKFQYGDALDLVLQKPTNPTIVTSLLDELVYRNTLPQALSNRTEETLQPLLIFINAFISNPKFSKLLIKVLDIILGKLILIRFICWCFCKESNHDRSIKEK
jgi:U3 small nucleolar RNA-associated protein 15